MPGQPCCCDEPCACGNCDGATPPCCFKVVISGIVEGSCGDCDCLNDTFHAPRVTACTWQRDTSAHLCDSEPLKVTVIEDAGDFKLKVELGGNVWIKNYTTTKPTCQSLTDESIPFDSSGSDCDASSSTCLVTAVTQDDDVNCPPAASLSQCDACKCRLLPFNGFQVELSGIINNDPVNCCSDCDAFDGVYIVTEETPGFPSPFCTHRHDNWGGLGPICGSDVLFLSLHVDTPAAGNTTLRVVIADAGDPVTCAARAAFFEKVFATAPDCRTFSAVDVPAARLPIAGNQQCDWAPATCTVTSLP